MLEVCLGYRGKPHDVQCRVALDTSAPTCRSSGMRPLHVLVIAAKAAIQKLWEVSGLLPNQSAPSRRHSHGVWTATGLPGPEFS